MLAYLSRKPEDLERCFALLDILCYGSFQGSKKCQPLKKFLETPARYQPGLPPSRWKSWMRCPKPQGRWNTWHTTLHFLAFSLGASLIDGESPAKAPWSGKSLEWAPGLWATLADNLERIAPVAWNLRGLDWRMALYVANHFVHPPLSKWPQIKTACGICLKFPIQSREGSGWTGKKSGCGGASGLETRGSGRVDCNSLQPPFQTSTTLTQKSGSISWKFHPDPDSPAGVIDGYPDGSGAEAAGDKISDNVRQITKMSHVAVLPNGRKMGRDPDSWIRCRDMFPIMAPHGTVKLSFVSAGKFVVPGLEGWKTRFFGSGSHFLDGKNWGLLQEF